MSDILTEFAIAAAVPTAQMFAFLIVGLLLRVDRCDK